MRLWEEPKLTKTWFKTRITKWLRLAVTSGDPLHPLLKQEQHHTRGVASRVLSLAVDRATASSLGQPFQNFSELPLSSVTWCIRKQRTIETKRASIAWRRLTELTVISKLRKLSMEMIEGEYIHIIKLLFWQGDFSLHRDIWYIYVIREQSAWDL